MGAPGPATSTGTATAKTAPAAAQNLAFLQKYGEDPDAATGKIPEGEQPEEEEGQAPPEGEQPEGEQPKGPIDVPVQNVKKGAEKVKGGILKLPSWGTITFPVIVLIILFALIIRINGKSRAEWLLDVLFGNAHLPPEPPTTIGNAPIFPGGGSSGGLGGPAGPINPLAAPPPQPAQDVQSLDGRVLEPANTFVIAVTGEG